MTRKIRRSFPKLSAGIGTAVCGALAWAGAAHADVKVVSSVAVTEVIQPALGQPIPNGTPPPQRQESSHSPVTVTTYYKGGDARTEVAGGPVTIYDGAAGKAYTLDLIQKTYYVQSYREAQEPPQGSAGGQMKVDADVDVKPGDSRKTFVGLPSQVYVVSGVVTLSPQHAGEQRGSGRSGGGRRHGHGGGGFPGGGFPGGGGFPLFQAGSFGSDGASGGYPNVGYAGRGGTRTVEVSGEFWLSDSLKLPDDKKATLLPAVQQAVSQGDVALKPLTDSLNKKKEIPLDSRITLTHTVPTTGAQDSVTTTSVVTAVSQPSLNDVLFQLPLGYTQIAPPVPD